MSPLIEVSSSDRCSGWMTLDLRKEEDVVAIVVFPLYGRNHHAGLDCWCEPKLEDGVIKHAVSH